MLQEQHVRLAERERDLLTFHAQHTDESSQAIAEHERQEVAHKRHTGAIHTQRMSTQTQVRLDYPLL